MNSIHAFMAFHPIRTKALFIADALAVAVCIAVAVWAHITDRDST